MSSYRGRGTGEGGETEGGETRGWREVSRSRNVLPLTKNNAHKSFVLVRTTLSREFTRRQVRGRRRVTRRNKSSASWPGTSEERERSALYEPQAAATSSRAKEKDREGERGEEDAP